MISANGEELSAAERLTTIQSFVQVSRVRSGLELLIRNGGPDWLSQAPMTPIWKLFAAGFCIFWRSGRNRTTQAKQGCESTIELDDRR